MDSAKIAKTIFNIAYFVGVLIALYFIIIYFFGSNEAMNPEAMLPFTWKDQAFFYLAIGSVPMLCACMAVYKFNGIKNSRHKKRNFILIFLPGFICSLCAISIIVVILLGMINSFVFRFY